MKFKILETGCTKCKQLYDNVNEAIKKSGVQYEIVKVEKLSLIISRVFL